MQYTVDYFIKKFEAVDRLGEGSLTEGCAYACCGVTHCEPTEEAIALSNIFPSNEFALVYGRIKLSQTVVDINDGYDERYIQPTPKQRILAALYDIRDAQKKSQQLSYPDLTKELASNINVGDMADQPVKEIAL